MFKKKKKQVFKTGFETGNCHNCGWREYPTGNKGKMCVLPQYTRKEPPFDCPDKIYDLILQAHLKELLDNEDIIPRVPKDLEGILPVQGDKEVNCNDCTHCLTTSVQKQRVCGQTGHYFETKEAFLAPVEECEGKYFERKMMND